MAGIKFWNAWAKPYKVLYFTLLSAFFVLLVTYLITYNWGVNNIIPWETTESINHVKYFIEEFDLGIFKIQAPSFSYVIDQAFTPGNIDISIPIAYIYFFIIFFSLAILNSLLTTLDRTYFLAGIVVLVLCFLFFKFELLGLFGIYENYIFISTIVILSGVSYYFHALQPDTPFLKRIIIFIALYALIAIFAHYFSHQKYPLLILANHGILFLSVVTVAFIVMVSHEIIYGFLFLVTYSASSGTKNALVHFVIVCGLYFLCLFLLYFKSIGSIDLQIFGTDAFLILPFSTVIGFLGFKAREISYGNIISFNPFGALLYITLAIICFATLGYVFITNNNPAIEAFEDFIIFTHIGVGIMFFIYIMANFGPLLGKNMNVYIVVFKPQRFPFYMVRLAGLIIVFAFMSKSNFLQVNQAISGYYNGLGDLSLLKGNNSLAIQHYKLAKEYNSFNHKSNYSLAQLALMENKDKEATYYLQETFKFKASPQSYAKLSDIFLKNNLYFDAIYVLRSGTKAFPQDKHLYNNLTLLYNKTALIDSAYLFLSMARKYSRNNEVIEGNYWSFLARNHKIMKINVDSIISEEGISDNLPILNNQLALFNLSNKRFDASLPAELLEDTILNDKEFSLLTNYSLNNIHKVDSTILKYISRPGLMTSENAFSENMAQLNATLHYYNLNRKKGFNLLNTLKEEGVTNISHYNLILGIWALQNQAYRLAVDYFNNALQKGSGEAFFYKAIALSEAGIKNDAVIAWRNVIQMNDPATAPVANKMITILEEDNLSELFELSDDLKYQVIRFKYNDFTYQQRDALAQTISSGDIRNRCKLFEAEKAFQAGNTSLSSQLLEELKNEKIEGSPIEDDIRFLSFKINPADKKSVEKFSSGKTVTKQGYYVRARINENDKNLKPDEQLYQKALEALPFDYKVTQDAVQFFRRINKNEVAYNIALDAAKINPYSPEALKLYVIESLNVNLDNYAADGMEKLKEITSDQDYASFEKIYLEKKNLKEASEEEWK